MPIIQWIFHTQVDQAILGLDGNETVVDLRFVQVASPNIKILMDKKSNAVSICQAL